MARDNFSVSTARILAERVGYLCSNHNCRIHTVGPNNNVEKSTKIGEAAHITAASEGGPRFDKNLRPGQRTNIENGIWLCSNCADLIDKDFVTYPVPFLKKWKADAELEMYEKINGFNRSSPTEFTTIKTTAPFLEADLRYNSSGRCNEGYSYKNPTELDEFGNAVMIIGFANSPIIYWKLDWEFSLLIYNNSTQPVFNIRINPLTNITFSKLAKLPKINNLLPIDKIEISAEFNSRIEGNYVEADALLANRIPIALDGLQLEISYLDEQRNEHKTIMTINGQDIINTRG